MNIQTAFIYCFLTFLLIYGLLWTDNNFFSREDSKEEKVLRTSILCAFINWVIIVYFIYQAEQVMPALITSSQELLDGNL